jgi:hypothetical protein
MSILDILEDLAEDLTNTFRDINCGGCCAAAAIYSGYLRGLLPHSIVVFSSWPIQSMRETRELIVESGGDVGDLHEWNERGFNFSHVAINFTYEDREYIFDSDGLHEYIDGIDRWGRYQDDVLSYEEAITLGNSHGWNQMFDRDQLDTMSVVVGQYENKMIEALRGGFMGVAL